MRVVFPLVNRRPGMGEEGPSWVSQGFYWYNTNDQKVSYGGEALLGLYFRSAIH